MGDIEARIRGLEKAIAKADEMIKSGNFSSGAIKTMQSLKARHEAALQILKNQRCK